MAFDSENRNVLDSHKSSTHWKDIVLQYEKRNALLEHRQAQLSERLRAMECSLPSMLMRAMVSMHRGTEPPKMDLESVLSRSGIPLDQGQNLPGRSVTKPIHSNDDHLRVELVYKRTDESSDPEETDEMKDPTSRFATGDDGTADPEEPRDPELRESVANLPLVSSKDLVALGRIQELAEQERFLKRYICDLESRERTFCETLERTNRLLQDPLECVNVCPDAEAREPLSDDPVMRRLQKLEFYNGRMIASMRGLRQEKNVLIKQTEFLKAQLRNTQEKLGQVQKKVLGEDKIVTVIGEENSFETVKASCSCASTTNKEDSRIENASPKTFLDLAEQFEDVLQKAKNHGLCKLSGTIKDAATKLKELSKSEEGYKCICDCPCESSINQVSQSQVNEFQAFQRDGPCSNCKCGKFNVEKFGETGDWFCDSCGGECVCDLVSLDEDYDSKDCGCGCRDDKIVCECGCESTDIKEIGEAGDIPKIVERKLSEDLKDIICKDCGNCKCGDDHSNCPDCIEACTCSCTPNKVIESLPKTDTLRRSKDKEPQEPEACGPSCPCNDSEGVWSPESDVIKELRRRYIILSGKKRGNPDLYPCFECEQSEPCDICLEEELSRSKLTKKIEGSVLQELLIFPSVPCEQCFTFDTKVNKKEVEINPLCNLCKVQGNTMLQNERPKLIGAEYATGSGDKTKPQKIHDPSCPCSCNSIESSNLNQCLCGCGVIVQNGHKEDESCPCGCGEIVRMPNSFQESGCDCECAKGGIHCDYCCCVESILEVLTDDKIIQDKPPETCPSTEDRIREIEMERLAKTLQQDLDSIGKKNNVLRQLVARCSCVEPEIIGESCPPEGCPYHDPVPIRPTISGLRAAIELLRVKSRCKDGMITILAENLIGKTDPGKIIEKLVNLKLTSHKLEDFDRCKLYNYLKRSEISGEINFSKFEQDTIHEDQVSDKYTMRITNLERSWSPKTIPAPRDFKIVKQICNDCLLITWTPPNDISMLNGYELLVNGYVASRFMSPTRTEALVISLDISRPVMLTLYSLGPGGSSSDPVRITFPECPCIND